MGLFFVSKSKYELLKEKYERAIENQKIAIEQKKESDEVNKKLVMERDYYQNESLKNYRLYRKLMSSNGGYKTASNKMKNMIADLQMQISYLESELNIPKDGLKAKKIIIDELHRVPLKYKPKKRKKSERKKEN